MAGMEWNPETDSVGVVAIDNQHQQMFQAIDALIASFGLRDRLAVYRRLLELSMIVRRHFKYEEAYLKRMELEPIALSAHREAHAHYLRFLSDCLRDFGAGEPLREKDITEFFTRWTRMHIQDRDLADFSAIAGR